MPTQRLDDPNLLHCSGMVEREFKIMILDRSLESLDVCSGKATAGISAFNFGKIVVSN